jgi:uncharacterized membrane protein
VPFSEIALIFRWIVPLWALGWLVLPLSARLLPFLPDQGLATGRIIAIGVLSLLTFWGAATHLVSLSFAPFALVLTPLLVGIGWRNAAFRAQIVGHRRNFLLSDAVFLLTFGFFLWVRLRNPSAGDLEKPMDIALLSAAMRAEFLPFENFWLAGEAFTNYYYFGPLMAANIARTLQTPPYLAYNLVQPLWCAFFVSTLWSLGAALAKSSKVGVGVAFLVALGGHFEPLRQIWQNGQLWPLDWWKTSRVIENTINEYPAFTMLTGDLHAHFYALSLAAAHFCLCFGILKAESPRLRSVLLLLGGVFLGIFALTNTWDVPLYGILWLSCALPSWKNAHWTPRNLQAFAIALLLVPLVALPYFLKFKAQVSGVVVDFWFPDLASFALLWGSWWLLAFWTLDASASDEKVSVEAVFRRFLIAVGIVALLFPFVFYLRGAFGDGALRHQDTVFKFGLQAWLLLGTGLAAQAGFRLNAWLKSTNWPLRLASATAMLAFFAIISLAPLCVAWTRTVRDAPRDALGNSILSLNAAHFLPPDELAGIEWLRRNARNGESVVEMVNRDPNGVPVGDYNPSVGRVAAFSGVPSVLGWPQHVGMWGGSWQDINQRAQLIETIYRWPNSRDGVKSLGESGATFVFIGAQERAQNGGILGIEVGKNGLSVARHWENSAFNPPQILRFQALMQSN